VIQFSAQFDRLTIDDTGWQMAEWLRWPVPVGLFGLISYNAVPAVRRFSRRTGTAHDPSRSDPIHCRFTRAPTADLSLLSSASSFCTPRQ
jgi:hypothetical protein